jgi:hypothetical protein
MNTWPEGLATVTVRWDDGTTLKVTRVKVGPEDLLLELNVPANEPFLMLGGPLTVKPVTSGRMGIGPCEMVPDTEDTFYEFRRGE